MGSLALVFLEPLWLAGLLAPLALVLASLRRRPSPSAYLGTARLFEAESQDAGSTRQRRAVPWVLAAASSLLLGALALARPGVAPTPPDGGLVTLYFDESPSMFLASDPGEAGGERRIDTALAKFQDWAKSEEERAGEDLFVRVAGQEGARSTAPRPWREVQAPAAPRLDRSEPLWSAFDEPGAVWITDGAEAAPPRRHAGLFASGGEPVPGPVSMGPNGSLVLESGGAIGFDESVRLSSGIAMGGGVPAELEALLGLWAEERGLRISRAPDSAALLRVEAVGRSLDGDNEAASVAAGRDGWEARLGVSTSTDSQPAKASPVATPWLVGPDGSVLVEAAPGRVLVRFSEIMDGPDDPAAFAVSFVGLFDASLLTPPGVVSAEERASAGEARALPPGRALSYTAAASADGGATTSAVGRAKAADVGALLRSLLSAGAAISALAALLLLARD